MKNYRKIHVDNFAASLSDAFGKSQQIGVVVWLMRHANAEQNIVATQREIAAELGASLASVVKVMNSLQTCEPPFIIKKGHGGVYRLNPEIFRAKPTDDKPGDDTVDW